MENSLNSKYKKKWTNHTYSNEQLKKVARDLYNGLIFCDRQCSDNDLMIVFMPVTFMGLSTSDSGREDRIYSILEKEIEQKYYNEFLSNIGFVYEYLSESGPTSVNGKPTFFSCKFLTKDDTNKMFEYYKQYQEIRESADNF